MNKLAKRTQLVVGSILENEGLTSELRDEAAKVLLDWGIAIAEGVVEETAEINDETAAEEAMYPQLRANRRMMKYTNRWIGKGLAGELEADLEKLNRIIEQFGNLYEGQFAPPTPEARESFLRQYYTLDHTNAQRVNHLREWLESHLVSPSLSGENHDQETQNQETQHLFRPQDLWCKKK